MISRNFLQTGPGWHTKHHCPIQIEWDPRLVTLSEQFPMLIIWRHYSQTCPCRHKWRRRGTRRSMWNSRPCRLLISLSQPVAIRIQRVIGASQKLKRRWWEILYRNLWLSQIWSLPKLKAPEVQIHNIYNRIECLIFQLSNMNLHNIGYIHSVWLQSSGLLYMSFPNIRQKLLSNKSVSTVRPYKRNPI